MTCYQELRNIQRKRKEKERTEERKKEVFIHFFSFSENNITNIDLFAVEYIVVVFDHMIFSIQDDKL